jgi:hypothetical protein
MEAAGVPHPGDVLKVQRLMLVRYQKYSYSSDRAKEVLDLGLRGGTRVVLGPPVFRLGLVEPQLKYQQWTQIVLTQLMSRS